MPKFAYLVVATVLLFTTAAVVHSADEQPVQPKEVCILMERSLVALGQVCSLPVD